MNRSLLLIVFPVMVIMSACSKKEEETPGKTVYPPIPANYLSAVQGRWLACGTTDSTLAYKFATDTLTFKDQGNRRYKISVYTVDPTHLYATNLDGYPDKLIPLQINPDSTISLYFIRQCRVR